MARGHTLSTMFHIKIEGSFEAAHYLRDYFPDGSAENLHGHSWRVYLCLTHRSRELNQKGLVVDFLEIRPEFDRLLGNLNHSCLNEHADFQKENPTAECVALWFYQKLLPMARKKAIVIIEVAVQEKPGHLAVFTPPDAGDAIGAVYASASTANLT